MESRRVLGSLVKEDCMGIDFVAEEMEIVPCTEGGYLLEGFDWLASQSVHPDGIDHVILW